MEYEKRFGEECLGSKYWLCFSSQMGSLLVFWELVVGFVFGVGSSLGCFFVGFGQIDLGLFAELGGIC